MKQCSTVQVQEDDCDVDVGLDSEVYWAQKINSLASVPAPNTSFTGTRAAEF